MNHVTASAIGHAPLSAPASYTQRFFRWLDKTAFGRFVQQRAQSFVAINSSIADMGYVLYAFTAGASLSPILLAGMTCKVSGSTILLADDKKGASASHEGGWPSRVVLFLHRRAKWLTKMVGRGLPARCKRRLPNPFTLALSLYAINGGTYLLNGALVLWQHLAWSGISQTAAGVTMLLGGASFAISGLEVNKGARELVWSRRGRICYAITPLFSASNFVASLMDGNVLRALALALVTSMAIFQIYVRHNFKRQRNVEAEE